MKNPEVSFTVPNIPASMRQAISNVLGFIAPRRKYVKSSSGKFVGSFDGITDEEAFWKALGKVGIQ